VSAGEYQLDVGDTIAMVNHVREMFGKPMISELPSATYGDPAACLFYRALADCGAQHVDGRHIGFASERVKRVSAGSGTVTVGCSRGRPGERSARRRRHRAGSSPTDQLG
jgi:hypothetical protein